MYLGLVGAAAARHFAMKCLNQGGIRIRKWRKHPILNVKRPVINKTEEPKDSQAMVKQYKLNATKKYRII